MELSYPFGMVELSVDTLLDLFLCCPVKYAFLSIQNETQSRYIFFFHLYLGTWSNVTHKFSDGWLNRQLKIHGMIDFCGASSDFQEDFGWDTDDRFGSTRQGQMEKLGELHVDQIQEGM